MSTWRRLSLSLPFDYKTVAHLILGVGFPHSSVSKESACNAGDLGSIPGLGGFPGEGNGNPLQYSCLESSTERRTWRATVHGIAELDVAEWVSLSHGCDWEKRITNWNSLEPDMRIQVFCIGLEVTCAHTSCLIISPVGSRTALIIKYLFAVKSMNCLLSE